MVRRDGPGGCVVPVVAGLVAGARLVAGPVVGAGVLAGASPAAGAWLPAAGAGLPVVVAWYWSIHWWRAG